MSTIVVWFKKAWLIVSITALGFAFMPLASAYAITSPDPNATPITTPKPTQRGTDRLVQVWAREQAIYSKLGTFLNNVDQRITKGQDLINKAKGNGKDTSALQTALDAFSAAVKQAQPIYKSTQGIVSSHSGFDANGQVTDRTQALTTVQDLGGKFKDIYQLLHDPRVALRDAIKAFRQANPPKASPTPNQSGG
jgi:hypothetical protein